MSYRQDICLLTTETLIKKRKKYVDELKKECEEKKKSSKINRGLHTNKLQRELRIAYEERDYGAVQNLRVNIETLTEQSKKFKRRNKRICR